MARAARLPHLAGIPQPPLLIAPTPKCLRVLPRLFEPDDNVVGRVRQKPVVADALNRLKPIPRVVMFGLRDVCPSRVEPGRAIVASFRLKRIALGIRSMRQIAFGRVDGARVFARCQKRLI